MLLFWFKWWSKSYFTNLYSSFQILSNFQIPQINLHNNFGTLYFLISILYLFQFKQLLYIFFDNYTAMLINRSIFGIITFYFILKYFTNRFTIQTSLVTAILIFFLQVFLELCTHHYQLSLFFYINTFTAR